MDHESIGLEGAAHRSDWTAERRQEFEEAVVAVIAEASDAAGLDAVDALERGAVYLESIYSLADPREGPHRALIAQAALWSPEKEVRFLAAGWCLNRQYFGEAHLAAGVVAGAILDSHPPAIRRRMREDHHRWVAEVAPVVAEAIAASPETVKALLARLRKQPELVTLPMLLEPADLLCGYVDQPDRDVVRRLLLTCAQMPASLTHDSARRAGELLDDLVRTCPLERAGKTGGIQCPVTDQPLRVGPWTEWSVTRGYENGPGAEQQETAYVTAEEYRNTLLPLGVGVLTLTAGNHGLHVRWRVKVKGERSTLLAPRDRSKKRRRPKRAVGGAKP